MNKFETFGEKQEYQVVSVSFNAGQEEPTPDEHLAAILRVRELVKKYQTFATELDPRFAPAAVFSGVARELSKALEDKEMTDNQLFCKECGCGEDHHLIIERIRSLYERTCEATIKGCSDDLEEFLADLRMALDGEQ